MSTGRRLTRVGWFPAVLTNVTVLAALATLASLATPVVAAPPAGGKAALKGYEEWLEKARQEWNVPGVAVVVGKADEVLLEKGFGMRDTEKKLPVTPKTIFAIGSCTKAFTTFVMATLVDEGKLAWDKPVRTWIPEFALMDKVAMERMTPLDLVTHRSGMPRHDALWYNSTLSRKEMVERLRWLEPSKDFRTDFQYNNAMFLTAGYLVERVTGKPWEDAVRERVFGPLGMTSANFSVVDSQKAPDFALPYEERDDKVIRKDFRNVTNVGPAGSINSSIEDLVPWLRIHLNGGKLGAKQILNASAISDLHTPRMETGQRMSPLDPDVIPGGYASGWGTDTYRGYQRVHHSGGIDGFTALIVLVPEQKIGIAVLANMEGSGFAGVVVRHALDRLLGLPLKDWSAERLARKKQNRENEKDAEAKKGSVRKPGTKPAHPLEDYAGEYEHPGIGVFSVGLKDGQLAMTYNGISNPLEHWHYEVWNAAKVKDEKADHAFEDTRLLFRTGMEGDIEAVEVPMEPAVKNIVFTRRADARLSDPAYLARFAGSYTLGPSTFTFSIQGKALVLHVNAQPQPELLPDQGDRFLLKGITGYSLRFVTGADGKVREAQVVQPEGVYTIKRKD